METKNKAKIVKAKTTLKEKVGHGGFDKKDLARAQNAIDENNIDFAPMAQALLDDLSVALIKIASTKPYDSSEMGSLTYPVLQLKAQGAMFNAPVYTDISSDLLAFLESVKVIDDPILEIMSSFLKIAGIITQLKIKESSHNTVKQLNSELRNVYDRYLNQRK